MIGEINQRRIATNSIHLNIAEMGAEMGAEPGAEHKGLVLMLHGFPESWYSWRHQFKALADAGYHAVAPDMRGYGKSDKPRDISAYNQVEIVNDIVGLIPALGYETAVVFGHDWGAPTAWSCALNHPDWITAVGGLSVPFVPRADTPPLDMIKLIFKDMFFYQLYFQKPGVAEAEFEKDIRLALKKFLYMASGDSDLALIPAKSPDSDLLSDLPEPESMPAWISEADLDYYVNEFANSGFRGPLNYYRNMNETWELTANAPRKITQPAMFIAGDKDGVVIMAAEAIAQLPENVPDLRVNKLIPGIGHWTQQEAPQDVNEAILGFLETLV